jgi:hypothetical protein
MRKLLGVVVEIAVIFLIGFICGAIWISKYAPSWLPDWLSPSGISYADLVIHSNDTGHFDGTIRLSNHEDLNVHVLVTVNVYEGDQDLGDLTGTVTLKPRSSSSVNLDSLDNFVAYDNTTIELLPIPVSTASGAG